MNRPDESPLSIVEERREFLHTCMTAVAGVTVVGLISPLLGGCEPTSLPTPTGAGGTGNDGVTFDVSALEADGAAVATTIKGSDGFSIIIARRSATEYISLSMRCTHQSCTVDDLIPEGGPISCPCHGSQFNLDGTVHRGPAGSPLKSYVTTFDPATKIVRVKVT